MVIWGNSDNEGWGEAIFHYSIHEKTHRNENERKYAKTFEWFSLCLYSIFLFWFSIVIFL